MLLQQRKAYSDIQTQEYQSLNAGMVGCCVA